MYSVLGMVKDHLVCARETSNQLSCEKIEVRLNTLTNFIQSSVYNSYAVINSSKLKTSNAELLLNAKYDLLRLRNSKR